jgi:hypothetical protein
MINIRVYLNFTDDIKYHRLKNNFDVSTDFKTNVKDL